MYKQAKTSNLNCIDYVHCVQCILDLVEETLP